MKYLSNKEEYLSLNNDSKINNKKNNQLILYFKSPHLYENNNHGRNKTKTLINILIFSIISILLVIFLLTIFHKLKLKNDIEYISIDNLLFTNEPLDDYNIKSLDNNNIQKEKIINITLPKETYKKIEQGQSNIYLTKEMVDKFNLFVSVCRNDSLIDNKKYPLLKNPKISAIIPIYNGGKYLNYSLRSIQNQKMKDIEIILIDDCSTDDTLSIIEKYMKDDERIRLIKNEENRKILYSKSIGALNANGKYIIQLDQDDIFIRDDVFDILYYEAENENLDLVHIRDISKDNFIFKNETKVNYPHRHYIFPKETHYKIQPELKYTMYIEGNNYLLWGLLIKADNYKKAVYCLWPIIINYKITFHEDYMISFMIIILTQKYKYLNNFALIHLSHSSATSKGFLNNKNFYLGVLFFGNSLYDYYLKNNPEDIKIIIHYIMYFKDAFRIGQTLFPRLYHFIINKIINNEYLSEKHKEYLKTRLEVKDSKEFKIWNTYEYLENNTEYKVIYNYQYSSVNKGIKVSKSKPKISIIIPCLEYKYLNNTINSIMNQNFTDIEIIIIYDNDKQTDLDLIQKYIKVFSNIRLINNGEKKGLVYSISTGALKSEGKYILVLEPSNTLTKENSLDEIYHKIIEENIDILEFNLLINSHENLKNNSLNIYKCHHFKSKIHLDGIIFNKNFTSIEKQKDLLINKLIKADLFKNIINEYKFNEYQRKIYNYYDDIFLYVLNKTNNTFKHIDNFGVIQNTNKTNSLEINKIINDKNQKIKDSIFYINFLFEYSNNTFEEKELVLNEYFNILSVIYNKFNSISKESYTLFEKFNKCKYISQLNKKYLQFYYNSLLN